MKYFNLIIIFFFSSMLFSQEENPSSFIDLNFFYGNVAIHKNDILHLASSHPSGFIISWNKRTNGSKPWHQRYNYPDYGFSITLQNFNNEILGKNYGLNAHYNFYLLKRRLMLRVGTGIAYVENPFNRETNFRNNAFGSRLVNSPYMMINYSKDNILDRLGFQAGMSIFHYSNGSIKAPNISVNTINLNIGVKYELDETPHAIMDRKKENKISEPIAFNFLFTTGVTESHVVGSGQYPNYTFTTYIDKKFNHYSAVQFGTELFLSKYLKEYIKYLAIAFPDRGINSNTDYKRIGIFLGHELFISKMSLITQYGYYIYNPSDLKRTYLRIGLKHYLGKKWFASINLKSHKFIAESFEFGLGIQL